MKPVCLALLATGWLGMSLSAQADVIDLTTLDEGDNGESVDLPEATITNLDGGVVFVGEAVAGQPNGFCFTNSEVSACNADGEIVFTSAVQDVGLYIDAFQAGDAVTINAFNGASFLGAIVVSGGGFLNLSSFGVLTRLFFDDSSILDPTGEGADGVGYSRIRFNQVASTVPEPGTLALLGLGLAGLGFSRRRAKA